MGPPNGAGGGEKVEWDGFAIDGAAKGHLGLGFETALQAVDRRGLTEAEIEALCTRGRASGPVLPAAASEYFDLSCHRLGEAPQVLPAGFRVLVITNGSVGLHTEAEDVAAAAGDTFVVPHGAGVVELSGTGTAVVVSPPG